jgi:hypothetical protein
VVVARVGVGTHGRIGHEGSGGGQKALGMEELRANIEHQEG